MRKRVLSTGLALVAPILLAQQADIPLQNWTVPPYRATSGGGITTMVDQTPPRVFIGLPVCRLLDTRPPANNPLDGDGIFATNQIRTYTLPGSCGIPTGTEAVSLNITVTNTVSNPFGHIKIWPADQAEPNVSTLNWAAGSVTESNAAIVALSVTPAGQIKVKSGNAGSDVIIDVNGYFSDTLQTTGNFLELSNNSPGFPTAFFHNASSATNSSGVFGLAGTSIPRPGYTAAGIRGEGALTGVLGISHLAGAVGSLVNGAGNEIAFGILGFTVDNPEPEITGDNVGVFGQTNDGAGGHAGVLGYAPAGTGRIYGVRGVTGSTSNDAAGVRGTDGGGSVQSSNWSSAGVRGESVTGTGVLGLSSSSSSAHCGVWGYSTSGGDFGALGCGSAGVTGTSVAATGNTSFVEPHPSDASVMIRYTSLQGNESGTYFRGRGKFQNGIAVIEVPEDFRIVTDPEGLSVQVTPIGQLATVAVESIGLDRIVVKASRNVEFFYTVNGIRSAYKDSRPIAEVGMFVPRSPDDPMPAYLPKALRERLISNGTYTADGKVNMETARRLGWDKHWEKRSQVPPERAP